MAQQPQPATGMLRRPLGYHFRPKGPKILLEHLLIPRALSGHPDPGGHIALGDIADGVDVYAVRPAALPFPTCNRGDDWGEDLIWGYFYAKQPAAAGLGVNGGDARLVAAGGVWWSNGGSQKLRYTRKDGVVVRAFRKRFSFYKPARAGGSKLTGWRMEEIRLDETAPAFRGVTFHPSAKELVILKVYLDGENPDEEPLIEYYTSNSDDDDKAITVRDVIAAPGAGAA